MSSNATVDSIKARLSDLGMPGSLEAIDDLMSRLDGGIMTPAEAIDNLLAAQVSLRQERRLISAMRSSRLPGIKRLGSCGYELILSSCIIFGLHNVRPVLVWRLYPRGFRRSLTPQAHMRPEKVIMNAPSVHYELGGCPVCESPHDLCPILDRSMQTFDSSRRLAYLEGS